MWIQRSDYRTKAGRPEVGCLHRNLGVIESLKEPLEFLWLTLELCLDDYSTLIQHRGMTGSLVDIQSYPIRHVFYHLHIDGLEG